MSGTGGSNPARVGVNTNIKQFNNTSTSSVQWYYKNSQVVPQKIKNDAANVLIDGDLTVNGNFYNPSDIILKENICYLKNTAKYDDVLNLEPAKYNFIDDSSKKERVGLIAQDVEKIFPELVNDLPIQPNIKTVNYIDLIPIMLHKMKKMQHEIDTLKSSKIDMETLTNVVADYNSSTLRILNSQKVEIDQLKKMLKTSK
jgi:hypothetical protein